MELPFVSLVLKALVLSLVLSITTFAKPTSNKLLYDVCRKTKDAKLCFKILNNGSRTHLSSSLHDLGLGALDIAILQAKSSLHVFNLLHNRKDIPVKDAEKYNVCRNDYELAVKKLGEAKTAWSKIKYVLTNKGIEVAYKAPISCAKKLVGISPAQLIPVSKVNEMSNITFEIVLVIQRELEAGKSMFTCARNRKLKYK